MRAREENGEISVHAVAGAHVVLLGFDCGPGARRGLLGFAVHRTDHATGDWDWLPGLLTFEETLPRPRPGQIVSSREHPLQKFLWGDYEAVAGHRYTYRVVPMYGSPAALAPDRPVEVSVSTEDEDDGVHAVYFNRGVAGSQAYARKFGNVVPSTRAQLAWLSRGLEEAMLGFIGQARSPRFGLRGAAYEFSYGPVLQAFGDAAKAGGDVRIVYDARAGKGKPVGASDAAIEQAGIRDLMIRRTENPSYISHNKFIVLLEKGEPVQVWTGSTNFTEGGIFGQTNVGHVVRDPRVAQAYLSYWEQLATDPQAGPFRSSNDAHTPVLEGPPPRNHVVPVFSPRGSLRALEWYQHLMENASQGVLFTAAFGVNSLFTQCFEEVKPYLRYVILDNPGTTASARHHTELIVGNHENRVAVGSTGRTSELHRWLDERLTHLNEHVRYIHTKFMLIDPLGEDPILVGGSANFSDDSTRNNDENMLVVRGHTRVADMYLGEFMRIFFHFLARDVAQERERRHTHSGRGAYLRPDDSWTRPYFEPGSVEDQERRHFR